MLQQTIDHVAGSVHHIQYAFGQTDIFKNFKNFGLRHGHLFGRLDDESVAGYKGIGQKPPGHHPRKVVGDNCCEYTQRLSMAHAVNVFGDVFQGITGHQRGDTGGMLNIFDHAPHFAARLIDALALLGGQDPGNLLEIFFKGFFHAEKIAGPC